MIPRSSTSRCISTTASNRFNTECLILSASRRTFDTYVTGVRKRLPDVVKSVVNNRNSKRSEAFRDDLLSFVSYQSVFWRECPPTGTINHQSSSPPLEHNANPSQHIPNITHYLVLGYVNGVQVWRFHQQFPLYLNTPSSLPASYLPATERVVGFRTLFPVTSVQLLPDIPKSCYPDRQPSCRLAVVQDRPDGNNSVDIFSALKGTNVHVLQQLWPVLRLDSSLSWTHHHGGQWIGTLVVATTQQIRIYDTETLDIRFTINDFQSISLPPLWRWLSANTPRFESPIMILPSNLSSSSEKSLCFTSSGPIFALGSRWFIYQTSPPLQQDLQRQLFDETRLYHCDSDWPINDWLSPATTAWKRLMSLSTLSRWTNTRLPSPFELLLRQSEGTLFPVVESHLINNNHRNWDIANESNFGVQPVGGSIVILDIITGEVSGYVNMQMGCPKVGTVSVDIMKGCPSRWMWKDPMKNCVDQHHRQFIAMDDLNISEIQDGSWWLSHVNQINCDRPKKTYQERNDGIDDQLNNVPFISFMKLDPSGTTLFCTEWTGRITWVIRLITKHQHYSSPSNRIVGVPIYELFRGLTAGTVVDVSSSCNLTGDTVVVVVSSRGSGHCFSLPSGIHQTQLKETNDTKRSISLIFPSSLSSTLLSQSNSRQNSWSRFNEAEFSSGVFKDDNHRCLPQGSNMANPNSRLSSILQVTAPQLSLRYCDRTLTERENPFHLRPACRLNLSRKRVEKVNFYWKVWFIPVPFFRRSSLPASESSPSRLHRLLRVRSSKYHKSFNEGNPYIALSTYNIPFLITSSDGVIDLCNAEFTLKRNAQENNLSYILESSLEPSHNQLIDNSCVIRNSSNTISFTTRDDSDGDGLHTLSLISSTPLEEINPPGHSVGNNPFITPVFSSGFISNQTSNVKFCNASLIHSFSTRDLELISSHFHMNDLCSPTAKSDGLAWSRHCEAVTSPSREGFSTLKFISISPTNSCPSINHVTKYTSSINLNRIFRSGDSIDNLLSFNESPDVSVKLRFAMDAALNTPMITTSSLPSARVISVSSYPIRSNHDRPPTTGPTQTLPNLSIEQTSDSVTLDSSLYYQQDPIHLQHDAIFHPSSNIHNSHDSISYFNQMMDDNYVLYQY